MEESRGWEGFSLSPLAKESSPLELNIPTPPQNSSKKGISPPSKTSIVLQSNLAHGEKRKNPTPCPLRHRFFSPSSFIPLSLSSRKFEGAGTSPSETKSLPFFIPHSRRYLIYYETRGHSSLLRKKGMPFVACPKRATRRKERKGKRPPTSPPSYTDLPGTSF